METLSHDDCAWNHQRFRNERWLYDANVHNRCELDDLPQRKGLRRDRKGWYPAGYCGRSLCKPPILHAGFEASKHPRPPGSQCQWGATECSRQHLRLEHPQGCHAARWPGVGLRVNQDADQRSGRCRYRGPRKSASHDFCTRGRTPDDVSRTRRDSGFWRDLSVSSEGVDDPIFEGIARHGGDLTRITCGWCRTDLPFGVCCEVGTFGSVE
jgi:hypothetical protein